MLRTALAIIGNLLILGLLVYLGITRSIKHALFASFIPVLPYFFVAFRVHKKFYLFCGSLLLSLSYFLAIRWLIPDQHLWLILPIPLILGYLISSHFSREEFSKILEIMGHLSFIYVVILAIQMHSGLSSLVGCLSMVAYVILYLIMAKVRKDANLVLGGAIAFALSYYFLLAIFPEIIASKQLFLLSIISVVYGAVGFGVSVKDKDIANSLYTAAVLVAIVSSFSVLLLQGVQGGSLVIIIGGLTFSLLMVLTKRSEYLYLVSLFLGFLAFRFLQIYGSEFLKELVDFFFYALLVLGAIFIFLFLKRRLELKTPFSFLIITGVKGRILLMIPVLFLVAIAFLVFYPIKVTMNPIFCGSCHNMETAIDTWENSVHGEVDCGKCHYLPGFKGFVKTKMGGLAESASYISGKYGKKILHHPELSDATCLACHHQEELFNADVEYKDELPFDHEFHLMEHPMDVELTCATCHSQVNTETHLP